MVEEQRNMNHFGMYQGVMKERRQEHIQQVHRCVMNRYIMMKEQEMFVCISSYVYLCMQTYVRADTAGIEYSCCMLDGAVRMKPHMNIIPRYIMNEIESLSYIYIYMGSHDMKECRIG